MPPLERARALALRAGVVLLGHVEDVAVGVAEDAQDVIAELEGHTDRIAVAAQGIVEHFGLAPFFEARRQSSPSGHQTAVRFRTRVERRTPARTPAEAS